MNLLGPWVVGPKWGWSEPFRPISALRVLTRGHPEIHYMVSFLLGCKAFPVSSMQKVEGEEHLQNTIPHWLSTHHLTERKCKVTSLCMKANIYLKK